MSKVALITGITGQDGAYLAKILLEKNYIVHAMRQPSALSDTQNISHLLSDLNLHYGDMTDGTSINKILKHVSPDEVYNLAAQSHVAVSFDVPEYTAQVNGLGVMRMLEAIRAQNSQAKFFQASTSELFGDSPAPQSEASLMNPRSPYAAAKKYAYDMVKIYREAYGMFACNGIMFNHESETRGAQFVTRKIAIAIGEIMRGKQECISLGNLDARRDWSHAEDIMRGAWMMMQQAQADDYILASGTSYSVREFATEAFRIAGIDLKWQGSGINEMALNAQTGKILITVDVNLFRPLDVEDLQGNAAKAKLKIGWTPLRNFETIVREMVEAELGYSTTSNVQRLHA